MPPRAGDLAPTAAGSFSQGKPRQNDPKGTPIREFSTPTSRENCRPDDTPAHTAASRRLPLLAAGDHSPPDAILTASLSAASRDRPSARGGGGSLGQKEIQVLS